jgi:ketosteroid isomerase-like protein
LRGKAAISEYYAKDVPAFATAGLATVEPPTSDVGVSGDLAWQSGTYKITDKSGATLDAGKYLTIFQRNDEKWMIIRDTWNYDAAPGTAPVLATPPK